MSYLMKATGKGRSTPQNQPIPGSKQVRNNAGGYGWEVDDLVRLRRFICLGCEKGTYYATEEKLAAENCTAIASLIAAGRGPEVVKEILDYSLNGRTAKQDPIIFALAMCARSSDPETKRLAYDAVGKVCRIPTFLFSFVQFVEAMDASTSGWGRGMRRAISSWYNDKDPRELAFAVTKYRQRNGWSHTDLLRLAHAKPKAEGHQLVFRYVTKGPEALPAFEEEGRKDEEEFDLCDQPLEAARAARRAHELLAVVEEVAKLEDLDVLCDRIRRFRLAREHIPTQHLNSLPVWRTLLEEMPLTAMIRNLAKMTTIGLLTEGSEHAAKVAEKLGNLEQLRRARVHPFNVLVALKIYSAGRGEKGKLTWTPVKQVVAALDRAFDLSFKCVEPTKQDVVIGLDVSGSMCCPVLGSESITCREASMAMAMVTARTEKNCKMMAFTGKFVPLHGVKPGNSLEDNLRAINGLPFGSTDCALPMVWALENRVRAETFIIYTDNDTWVGKIHPSEALVKYRREMNVPHAKLIVVAMSPSKFSIADPNDRGMLDIAGFDANAPEVMRNFMLGLL